MIRFLGTTVTHLSPHKGLVGLAGLLALVALATTGLVALHRYSSSAAGAGRSPASVRSVNISTSTTPPAASSPNSSLPSEEFLNSTSFSQSSSQMPVHTNVTVNGQTIPVPQNGNVTRTIEDQTGTTKVNVNSQTGSTASNNSNSSVNINVSTNSSVTSNGEG